MIVPGGLGDGGESLLRHTHEVMFRGRRSDRIDRDAQASVRAVLETDGEGKPTCQLTVQLRFGGPCANGPQGNQIGEELRGNGIQHLAGDGHSQRREVAEQLSRYPEPFVDFEGFVDFGVVDETFPADGGAGFLEVGAHDDAEVFGVRFGEGEQALGVFEGGAGVVNGAGTDHDEEAVIGLGYAADGLAAAAEDGVLGFGGLGRLSVR